MKIAPFALERYFAKYEFSAQYLLSCSDCEPLAMSELLAMADTETAHLWEHLKLGYTESPGHPLLREAITEIYAGIEAQDILVLVPSGTSTRKGFFCCCTRCSSRETTRSAPSRLTSRCTRWPAR